MLLRRQDVLLITAEDDTGAPVATAPTIAALLPPGGNLDDIRIQMNGGRLTTCAHTVVSGSGIMVRVKVCSTLTAPAPPVPSSRTPGTALSPRPSWVATDGMSEVLTSDRSDQSSALLTASCVVGSHASAQVLIGRNSGLFEA